MSSVSSDDMDVSNYEVPELYEVTSDMIVAPGVYQTNPEKYHASCKCLDADLNPRWVRPVDDNLFENIEQGEFPDWLKIHDSEVDVLEAMCRAKPKDYVYHSPVEAYCPFAEDEITIDDEFWGQADGTIEPVEQLPFESLITMLNTFEFPATGMESVMLWMKIYARYWFSYGFCLLRVEEKKEFEMFRREILDPKEVWMLPYWCLWDVGKGRWCRHMLLVVRNTRRFVEKWEDLDTTIIGNAFQFLKAIASVSVPRGTGHLVAHPMIPHALKWMCILVPDCYEEYIRTYPEEFYTISDRGISCCRLTIGSDDRINVYASVPKKDMAKNMTGKPFVFGEGKCYFVVTRGPMLFEGMIFSVSKQQQAFLNCMEPLEARTRASKQENETLKTSIRELKQEREKLEKDASIRKLKQENEKLEKENDKLKQENEKLKRENRGLKSVISQAGIGFSENWTN